MSFPVVDGEGGLVGRFFGAVQPVVFGLMVEVVEQRALQLLERRSYVLVRRLVQQRLHPRKPAVAHETVSCARQK